MCSKLIVKIFALWALFFALCANAVPMCPLSLPEGPIVIYEDRLSNGWSKDWSWANTVEEQTAPGGQYGSYAMKVIYGSAWQGLELHKGYLVTLGKTALSFRIMKQQAQGDILVRLRDDGGGDTHFVHVSSYLSSNQSTTFVAGQWYSVNIPLADFGMQGVPLSGIIFQSDTAGTAYVDEVVIAEVPLTLKWPLGTPYADRFVTHKFDVDWAGGSECPTGVIKKHNGTDFRASAGTAVYAAENGVVKEILPYNATWAQNIVLEHVTSSGQKYTTVYWHVAPVAGLSSFVGPIAKGQQIATVADIGIDTHFHLGVHLGAYTANVSGTGALPQNDCTDPGKTFAYPAFPAGFVDPNDTRNVLFQ